MNKAKLSLLCVGLVVLLSGPAVATAQTPEAPDAAASPSVPRHPLEQAHQESWSGPAQAEIDAIVAAHPGARQISQYKVELQPGVVLGVPAAGPATQAGGDPSVLNHPDSDCWSGWVCFFEHAGYGGHMLELYYCDTVELINTPMDPLQNWQNKISSWIDVQTGGAFARLYYFERQVATTSNPRAEDFAGAANDFSTHIDPC